MRALPSWTLASLLPALLAGCLGGSADLDDFVSLADYDGASLERPPAWEVGDWWRLDVQDHLTGRTFEVVQVVAAVRGDHYLVGFGEGTWEDMLIILHVPGFGEVDRASLGYDIHDLTFEPLRFPLRDGDSWETTFEGVAATATVQVASATQATVQLTGAAPATAHYDAEAGAIVRFEAPTYASWSVVASGRGFVGVVEVPEGQDLVLLNGRIAGVLAPGLQPAAPVESVTVDGSYDRLTLGLILGTILPTDRSPQGVYRETATAPDGTVYEAVVTPLDDPGLHVWVHNHASPAGTWRLEHVVAGPGVALTEGVAYRLGAYNLGAAEGTGESGEEATDAGAQAVPSVEAGFDPAPWPSAFTAATV